MKAFKAILTLSAVVSLALGATGPAPSEELIAPGMINFQGLKAATVVGIYKDLTGGTFYVDSRVKQSDASIFWANEKPISKAEAGKMIEQALLEQAAVVITKLDSNRVSVTFNDALPRKTLRSKSER